VLTKVEQTGMSGMGDLEVKAKAMKVKSNVKQQRCDDYSVIGGVLGAVSCRSRSCVRRGSKLTSVSL